MKPKLNLVFTGLFAISFSACSSDPAPPTPDAAVADVSSTDVSSTDVSSTDVSSTDVSSTDVSSTDVSGTDVSSTDAGSTDAGSTDAGSTDAGSTDAGSADAGSADAGSTSFAVSVLPIFMVKCATCHTTGGSGGNNLGASYADTQRPSTSVPGMTIGAASLVRIRSGSMPRNRMCTGNPAMDAMNPRCLTEAEHRVLEAWIAGGQRP